ncbi:MAG: hypothetical protein ACQCXQ_03755 [Verrucomicrobiales bacterium]
MKTMKLLIAVGFAAVSVAPAATLELLDFSSLPAVPSDPAGAHYDAYDFPLSILPGDSGNPITSLSVDYEAVVAFAGAAGLHEILSVYFMFSSGNLVELDSTPTHYSARVDFTEGVTGVSDELAPAFVALHGPAPGLTSLLWTASYLDGSESCALDGIIPEPGVCALGAVGGLGLLCRRKRKVPGKRVAVTA